MPGNYKRVKAFTKAEAQALALKLFGEGKDIEFVAKAVQLNTGSIRNWKSSSRPEDIEYQAALARITAQEQIEHREEQERKPVPPLPEFMKIYGGLDFFEHQYQIHDMIEGRVPRNLRGSMVHIEGDPFFRMVNIPPGFAKSTTFTVWDTIRLICEDPDVRVAIISETADLAEKFLRQIKEILLDPAYEKLQQDFAPSQGWEDKSKPNNNQEIYIRGRKSGKDKDPTVIALGISSQLRGRRIDHAKIDDAESGKTVSQYEKHAEWVNGELTSRITPEIGSITIIGTRTASNDMYSELLRANNDDFDMFTGWTYLKMPALIDDSDPDPKNWDVLWKESNIPLHRNQKPNPSGLYSRFDGPALARIRSRQTKLGVWQRMYQQEQFEDDSLFDSKLVNSACEGRHAGVIPAVESLGRAEGMEGLYIVAGLDPASVNYSAFVVNGVERKTGHVYKIDIVNKLGMRIDQMRDEMKSLTLKYGVKEWIVERNNFQRMIAQEPELNRWMAAHGSKIIEFFTNGKNKHDPDTGVAAMADLYVNGLMHLPNNKSSAVKSFIEQLCMWMPDAPKTQKTDMVMADWLSVQRCQELVRVESRQNAFMPSRYMSDRDHQNQKILNIEDYQERVNNQNRNSYMRGINA